MKTIISIALMIFMVAAHSVEFEKSAYYAEYQAYQKVLAAQVESKKITTEEAQFLDIQKLNELQARIQQENDVARSRRIQGFMLWQGMQGGGFGCRANTIGNRTYTNCQ